MRQATYYGLIGKGRQVAQVLVTRDLDTKRQVSQVETGVTYRTMREGMNAIEALNVASWAEQRKALAL